MQRSLKLFLLATAIEGFIFSGWSLFFNLFFLARGFDRDFLGLVNSLPSIASLFFGIPLGILSDRLGRRKVLLLGLSLYMASLIIQVSVRSAIGIAVFVFLGGVGSTLFVISQAPFMMSNSKPEERAFIFSLNYSLATLVGVLGSLLAGVLPGVFANLLHLEATSAGVYQLVLTICAALGSLSIIPILFIERESKVLVTPGELKPRLREIFSRPTVLKLVIPNLVIGLGAAVLMPYMNVFFVEKFKLDANALGLLFSLSSLLIGIGVIFGPKLAEALKGKIAAIVLSQGVSLVFLYLLGFTPLGWLAQVSFLIRGSLMNIANPLFSAFAMEQTPENEQGTVNSILNIAWTLGWAVGPYISGFVMQRYGFTPLFITTLILYSLATWLIWQFFYKTDSAHFAK